MFDLRLVEVVFRADLGQLHHVELLAWTGAFLVILLVSLRSRCPPGGGVGC